MPDFQIGSNLMIPRGRPFLFGPVYATSLRIIRNARGAVALAIKNRFANLQDVHYPTYVTALLEINLRWIYPRSQVTLTVKSRVEAQAMKSSHSIPRIRLVFSVQENMKLHFGTPRPGQSKVLDFNFPTSAAIVLILFAGQFLQLRVFPFWVTETSPLAV